MKDEQALQTAKKIVADKGDDPEVLHGALDQYMIKLLDEAGYKETAAFLSEQQSRLWYA